VGDSLVQAPGSTRGDRLGRGSLHRRLGEPVVGMQFPPDELLRTLAGRHAQRELSHIGGNGDAPRR
jgi:hypothetical protein